MGGVKSLTPKDVADIRKRLLRGEYQHDIAADYGLNQGRISEINTGKRHAGDSGMPQANLF